MNSPESPRTDRPLLVVIDMQASFLKAIPHGPPVSWRCGFALSAAKLLGLPVLFTEQAPAKLGATDPVLAGLAAGAPVIAKNTFSALAEPAFVAEIGRLGANHLLVAGIETPVCVLQTAVGAIEHGLRVTVLSDCVGARRADDATAVLRHLATQGCRVLPSEAVFYAILGGANHPAFREYTALVKAFGK